MLPAQVSMMRLLSLLLVIALAGGHLACLQAVAWAGMFADRVQSAPTVAAALISTIDGSRPCGLCRVVDQLADAGKGPVEPPDKQLKKAEKSVIFVREIPTPAVSGWSYPDVEMASPRTRGEAPETPPPIG